MPSPLRFRQDGTFTIVQFTDTHWHNGEEPDLNTRALIESVLEVERPDLVALTGDVIAGRGCTDPAESWRQMVEPMERRGIRWAAVFGNHDDEGVTSRSELMAIQQELPMCLSEPGPPDVSGVGNYALRIGSATGDALAAALYFLDSNSYSETDLGGYGWIRRDQIAWYLETARKFKEEYGSPVPALAFFHIPLPEYDEVWDHFPCNGAKYEAVCCPRINTGFFAALHETGDVMGAFVGHDHVNDFDGNLYGIRLCYGRGSGYHTYGRPGFERGARVIQLQETSREFVSWLRLEGGEYVLQQPSHEPQGRVLSS